MHLNDHALAKEDFGRVVQLDDSNKAARNKVAICMQEIKKQKAQEKKTFANMFDKFARMDARKEELARKNQPPLDITEWEKNEKNREAAASKGDMPEERLKVSGDVQMDLDINKEMDKMNE